MCLAERVPGCPQLALAGSPPLVGPGDGVLSTVLSPCLSSPYPMIPNNQPPLPPPSPPPRQSGSILPSQHTHLLSAVYLLISSGVACCEHLQVLWSVLHHVATDLPHNTSYPCPSTISFYTEGISYKTAVIMFSPQKIFWFVLTTQMQNSALIAAGLF